MAISIDELKKRSENLDKRTKEYFDKGGQASLFIKSLGFVIKYAVTYLERKLGKM